MADVAVRDSARKSTIEIQRRPARQGTITKAARPASNQPPPNPQIVTVKPVTDPSQIPQALENVTVPEMFDEASTIVACNFPPNLTIHQCKCFMSWIGPIVRVEKLPSCNQETNFIVVFAQVKSRDLALDSDIIFEDGKTHIYCRGFDAEGKMWVMMKRYMKSFQSMVGL